jgi:tetratricopeptide (TPR) repeat protein
MILTQCAVCATELGLSLGKKCGRCSTRYCGPECQVQHWKDGGHDKLCRKIKKAGGAEQYNADQRYAKAVVEAAEKCADDTKGQTCYICTQALHWKTKEGLVRGCSCRGTAGFAHVSCLAEQAKILVEEAVENNLGGKAIHTRFQRWHTCSLCEQHYHGLVYCALGWACWKTYVGRPETDVARIMAMTTLGNGLYLAEHYEDALTVREAELPTIRRLGTSERHMFVAQSNLASSYQRLGRLEEASRMLRDVYSGSVQFYGEEHRESLREANNYANALHNLRRFKEVKALLRKMLPVAQRVLTDIHEITLKMRWTYASALHDDPSATLDDFREAVTTLEDLGRIARRLLGPSHPLVEDSEKCLRNARATARARELNVSSLADELEAMTPGDA